MGFVYACQFCGKRVETITGLAVSVRCDWCGNMLFLSNVSSGVGSDPVSLLAAASESYPMCPDISLLKSLGEDTCVYRHARLLRPEQIRIGNCCIVDDLVTLDGGAGTRIGDFTHLAGHGLYAGGGELVIGSFCGLSGGICIYTGSDDFVGDSLGNPTIPYPFRQPVRSFVRIGDHVQIGANSVVLPGVTIGEGAAIGAMTLVLRDCEPWTIYVGNPARPLRARPRERILELEARLRRVAYDDDGAYLPKERWRWKEGGEKYPLWEELER